MIEYLEEAVRRWRDYDCTDIEIINGLQNTPRIRQPLLDEGITEDQITEAVTELRNKVLAMGVTEEEIAWTIAQLATD